MSGSLASPAAVAGDLEGGDPVRVDQRRAHAARLDLEVALDGRVRAPHEPELVVRRVVGDGGIGSLVGVGVERIGVGDPRRLAGRRAGRRHDLADDLFLAGGVVRAGRRRRDVGQDVGVDGGAVADDRLLGRAGHRRQPAHDALRACRCRRAPGRRPRSRRARRDRGRARRAGTRRRASCRRSSGRGPRTRDCRPGRSGSASAARPRPRRRPRGRWRESGRRRRPPSRGVEKRAGHALAPTRADGAPIPLTTRA